MDQEPSVAILSSDGERENLSDQLSSSLALLWWLLLLLPLVAAAAAAAADAASATPPLPQQESYHFDTKPVVTAIANYNLAVREVGTDGGRNQR